MNTDIENIIIVTGSDKFTLTGTALVIAPNATYEEWMNYGKYLAQRYSAIQWAIGDWINYGEMRWGEKYAQVLDDLSFAYGTLRNYASICARIPPDNRNPRLRFHQIKHVACLTPNEQKKVIETAVKLKLTGDEILEAVQKINGKSKPILESADGIIWKTYELDGREYVTVQLEKGAKLSANQFVSIKVKH